MFSVALRRDCKYNYASAVRLLACLSGKVAIVA